jgi:hypothetical protein
MAQGLGLGVVGWSPLGGGFPHDMLAAEAQTKRLAGGIPDQVDAIPTPVA